MIFLSVQGIFARQKNYPSHFTVSQNGDGDFTTIQAAVNAVRDLSQQQVIIFIKKGIYKEKIIIPSWKTNIRLTGEDKANTIITFDDYSGKKYASCNTTDSLKHSTFDSYTLLIAGNDCSLENLTVRNTAGRVGQAVALDVQGTRCKIINCILNGNQDTLFTDNDNSYQYFADCSISGTTDFIFGSATAVFERCEIKSLANSYIAAPATSEGKKFGYVFLNCTLVADSGVHKVYLGRPWRPYAKAVYIRTKMGAHILPQGWDNWRNPDNEKTAFFAEYKCSGKGAVRAKRTVWSKQLTDNEAKEYTLNNIFKDWNVSASL